MTMWSLSVHGPAGTIRGFLKQAILPDVWRKARPWPPSVITPSTPSPGAKVLGHCCSRRGAGGDASLSGAGKVRSGTAPPRNRELSRHLDDSSVSSEGRCVDAWRGSVRASERKSRSPRRRASTRARKRTTESREEHTDTGRCANSSGRARQISQRR